MPDRPQSNTSRAPYRRNKKRARTTPRPATTLHSPSTQIVITPKVAATLSKERTPDYSYVSKDLKSIAIIVGGIVVVFIVLYFMWK